MTVRLLSKMGRITQPGHIVGIVRNVLTMDAASMVGRILMLSEGGAEGTLRIHSFPASAAVMHGFETKSHGCTHLCIPALSTHLGVLHAATPAACQGDCVLTAKAASSFDAKLRLIALCRCSSSG